jgi:hypothetical protein
MPSASLNFSFHSAPAVLATSSPVAEQPPVEPGLIEHIETWFTALASPCTVFVPCVITRWRAPRFSIGDVDFVFIDDVGQNEFYPLADPDDVGSREGINKLLQFMRDTRGYWVACAPIDGCEPYRAQEIGSLAVDLAIVALQLAFPNGSTRSMSRLDSRRGAADKVTVTKSRAFLQRRLDQHGCRHRNRRRHPPDIFSRYHDLISAVGNRVRSFASGRFRLQALEQAWCDAAYWLDQALAEPMDSIAIAKLETPLEVLLRSESSSGSQSRILTAVDLFFGLKPEDPILADSPVGAKQFAAAAVGDRSRILHGTSSTLNSRLARNSLGLEGFVIAVVRRAVIELDAYAQSSAPPIASMHFSRGLGSMYAPRLSRIVRCAHGAFS